MFLVLFHVSTFAHPCQDPSGSSEDFPTDLRFCSRFAPRPHGFLRVLPWRYMACLQKFQVLGALCRVNERFNRSEELSVETDSGHGLAAKLAGEVDGDSESDEEGCCVFPALQGPLCPPGKRVGNRPDR
eukprot:s1255_g3.t1